MSYLTLDRSSPAGRKIIREAWLADSLHGRGRPEPEDAQLWLDIVSHIADRLNDGDASAMIRREYMAAAHQAYLSCGGVLDSPGHETWIAREARVMDVLLIAAAKLFRRRRRKVSR